MCPLAAGEGLDPEFADRVGKAFRLLARDPKMLAFMCMRWAALEK